MYYSKIIHLFIFIFLITPKSSWAQEFMYFIKGEDMKTVSFLEAGSALAFSSEDVIINGEKLVKTGKVRFTNKYMVFPSRINSSNGGIDIDVYWSLGSTNYNCIIDWGNNTLEQFQLIEVDIASYKKSIKGQNEIKKSKFLSDLPLKLENLERELDKTVDLNKKLVLVNSIVNEYNEYKKLFQNDPPEIVKLNQLSNEISSQIEKQKNEVIYNDKKMDSLRILNVRVVSYSNSDRSIDTFMVLKRATSLVFHTFFKDSSYVLNNYLDSNFISEVSKKIDVIKILNSTYLDDTTNMQVCELNIPLIDFFDLGKNLGWKLPIPNLKHGTIFKVRKWDFLKNQEFNAMCDIIGSLHNLTIQSLESKVKKSALTNESNLWKAKYEIDITFNEKIDNIRKLLVDNFTYFSLSNLDLSNTYTSDLNIEKFLIFITPEIGEKSDIVSTDKGNYIQYVITNKLTFNLIKDYFKKLDNFYFKQWSVNFYNKIYFGTQKEMIWNFNNQHKETDTKYWTYDHFSLRTEYERNTISFKFPQKSQILTTYYINHVLTETEIEKYTDTLKFNFKNRVMYNYKSGGLKKVVYTYGVTLKHDNLYGSPVLIYNKTSIFTPTQLLPLIREGWGIANISYAGEFYKPRNENTNLILYELDDHPNNYVICHPYWSDTLTREFSFLWGGGRSGKKPLTVYARPTKVEVLYSLYPLYVSNMNENDNIMISYLTDWYTNYSTDNWELELIDSYLIKWNYFNNHSKYTNATSRDESPHSGFKILKIEKQ